MTRHLALVIDRSGCPGTKTHGRATDYADHGCRCPDAGNAERIRRKRRREGRPVPWASIDLELVDATGAARRLQSLMVSGHGSGALGRRLGVTHGRVHHLVTMRFPQVTRKVHADVRRLFAELDGTDGGDRRARTTAAKHGWHDADAWDNIDDPDEKPKRRRSPKRLTTTRRQDDMIIVERLETVRVRTLMGESVPEIAVRLHLDNRTVQRYREQLRAAGRLPQLTQQPERISA